MPITSVEINVKDGDDPRGKTFVITKMSAFEADKWARHLVKALTRAGQQLPDSALQAGVAGLAGLAMNMFGYLDDDAADKALDRLQACAQIRPDPDKPLVLRPIHTSDIEDGATLTQIRAEAFKLHLDFFRAAAFQLSPIVAALMPGAGSESAPTA